MGLLEDGNLLSKTRTLSLISVVSRYLTVRGTYVPGFWSEYGLNEMVCMLIVAVVEFSPFDGLFVEQWIERNCGNTIN